MRICLETVLLGGAQFQSSLSAVQPTISTANTSQQRQPSSLSKHQTRISSRGSIQKKPRSSPEWKEAPGISGEVLWRVTLYEVKKSKDQLHSARRTNSRQPSAKTSEEEQSDLMRELRHTVCGAMLILFPTITRPLTRLLQLTAPHITESPKTPEISISVECNSVLPFLARFVSPISFPSLPHIFFTFILI